MAFQFRIYDGLDDVVFATAGLYLKRGGYKQKGAEEVRDGVWADLEETAVFLWVDEVIDTAVLQALNRLGLRARQNQNPSSTNYGLLKNQVILQVRADNETGTRYAVLRSLRISELEPDHWRPNATPNVKLEWIREGVWRDVPPDPAEMATVVDGVTLDMYHNDGDTKRNFVIVSHGRSNEELVSDPNFASTAWTGTGTLIFTAGQSFGGRSGQLMWHDLTELGDSTYTSAWATLPTGDYADVVRAAFYFALDTYNTSGSVADIASQWTCQIEFNDGGATKVAFDLSPIVALDTWYELILTAAIPSGATAVRFAGTVANQYPYGDFFAYMSAASIERATAAQGGDATGQLFIEDTTGSGGFLAPLFTTAVRDYDSLSDAVACRLSLNPDDELDLTKAAGDGPDSRKITVSSGFSAVVGRWQLPGVPRLYNGSWRVYLVSRLLSGYVSTIKAGCSLGTVGVSGVENTDWYAYNHVNYTNWNVTFAGNLLIATEGEVQPSELYLKVALTDTSGATLPALEIAGVFLVPQEKIHAVYESDSLIYADELTIDGLNQRTFLYHNSNGRHTEVIPSGNYNIEPMPGRVSVLYLFPLDNQTGLYTYDYTRNDIDVTVRALTRYQAVR